MYNFKKDKGVYYEKEENRFTLYFDFIKFDKCIIFSLTNRGVGTMVLAGIVLDSYFLKGIGVRNREKRKKCKFYFQS